MMSQSDLAGNSPAGQGRHPPLPPEAHQAALTVDLLSPAAEDSSVLEHAAFQGKQASEMAMCACKEMRHK